MLRLHNQRYKQHSQCRSSSRVRPPCS
jgi:hypothetical protein